MARTQEQTEALLDKLEKLLKLWDDSNDRHDRSEWGKKYGERLGKYSEKLKLLNGDDFDLLKESYDEHKNGFSDLSDDEYVDGLEENIKKVIQRVWPEATEEEAEAVAKQVSEEAQDNAGDGEFVEAHVEAEDENGDGDITEDEIETHTLSEDEDSTSDARQKRIAKMSNAWTGSPHTSGGRDGKTSDEDQKEDPEEDEDEEEEKPRTKRHAYDPMDRFN